VARPATYDPLADLRRGPPDARREGADFESAWSVSLSAARFPGDTETRVWYREALHTTREEWRRAYVGEPPGAHGVAALLLLASLLDAEPLFGTPEPRAPAPPEKITVFQTAPGASGTSS
jgi:hypothetical protein